MVAMPENQRISLSGMLREYESKNTRRIYISVLKDYLGFIYPECKTEINEKKEELDVQYLPPGVKMEILDGFSLRYIDSDRNLRDDLLRYREHIAKQAPKSRALKLTAVNQFLNVNGVHIPDDFSRRLFNFKEDGAISSERIPTNDDLKRIAEYLPVHGKALMLVLASGGMRVDEAVQLRDDDLDLTSDPVRIRLRAGTTKTGQQRITFVTQEAKVAVEEWLTYRPQYLATASGRSAKHRREGKYDGVLFPFTAGNFSAIWIGALQKAGLYEVDARTNRVAMRVHNLRKFFRLRVGKHGRDEAEALMGHQTGLNRVYADFGGAAGEARLETAYKRAIADLSIYDRSIVIQRADKAVRADLRRHEDAIDVLEDENLKLKEELEQYKASHATIEKYLIAMSARIEKLELDLERERLSDDDLYDNAPTPSKRRQPFAT